MSLSRLWLGLLLMLIQPAVAAQHSLIDDLKSIHLGMTYGQLRLIRPGIRPSSEEGMAGEKVSGDAWFTSVFYVFSDYQLDSMSLRCWQCEAAQILDRRNGLLKRLVSVLGFPSNQAVIGLYDSEQALKESEIPIVIWERRDSTIVLRLPTEKLGDAAPTFYSLEMLRHEEALGLMAAKKHLSKKECAAFFENAGLRLDRPNSDSGKP